MTTFLFVRHGEPRYDEVEQRNYFGMGRDLGKLTANGEKQAETVAGDTRFKGADLIIASPYTRALQTAAIISRMTNIPLTVENDLHEWMPDTTHKYQIKDWDLWWKEYYSSQGVRTSDTLYTWEAIDAVRVRVNNVLEKYKHLKKVIVVCHGIVMSSQTAFDRIFDFCEVCEITK